MAEAGRQLEPLNVAELCAGVAGPFAGRLLVNLGANVVKVEEGDGDWTRRKPPMVELDGERSGALFHFLNAGKRSVLADSSSVIEVLWSWADIVLVDEEFLARPDVAGLIDRFGPSVVTSITPYGRSGPDRDRPGTASTAFARCGEGSITPGGIGFHEFPDAPPVVARGKVADLDAGAMALIPTLAAVISREEPARPVQVDVSVFETEVSNNRWIASNYARTGWIETRESKPYPFGGMLPCKDGYAMFLPSTDRIWQAFVRIMGEPEWALSEHLATREGRVADADAVKVRIAEWASGVTKAELLEAGLEMGVPLGPYRSVEEVAGCPQLGERGFFLTYGESHRIPGLPAPGFTTAERIAVAPRLGEHDLPTSSKEDADV